MANKKVSLSLTSLVCGILAIVGVVLSVIGVFTNFIKCKVEGNVLGFGGNSEALYKLSDLADGDLEMYGAMNAFAYVVMGLTILSLVLLVLSFLSKNSLVSTVASLSGVLTVVATILLFVFVLVFCSKNSSTSSAGGLASGSVDYTVAAGAVLTLIGGLVAGLTTLYAKLKK